MNTTASRSPRLSPPWFKHAFWRAHRVLYRLSGGRFLWTPTNKRGWGALHLTTLGRQSGQNRSVIFGYIEDGPNLVALASRPEARRVCRSAVARDASSRLRTLRPGHMKRVGPGDETAGWLSR